MFSFFNKNTSSVDDEDVLPYILCRYIHESNEDITTHSYDLSLFVERLQKKRDCLKSENKTLNKDITICKTKLVAVQNTTIPTSFVRVIPSSSDIPLSKRKSKKLISGKFQPKLDMVEEENHESFLTWLGVDLAKPHKKYLWRSSEQ